MLQYYNKILTKCIVFSIILNPRSRPPHTHTHKKSAYFTHPNFSAAKIEKKSAQITRANTVKLFFLIQGLVYYCTKQIEENRDQNMRNNNSFTHFHLLLY